MQQTQEEIIIEILERWFDDRMDLIAEFLGSSYREAEIAIEEMNEYALSLGVKINIKNSFIQY